MVVVVVVAAVVAVMVVVAALELTPPGHFFLGRPETLAGAMH